MSEEEIVPGQTGALAAALAKAQAKFPQVGKDKSAEIRSEKGTYRYSYADLASILAAVRAPLAENGLAVVQPIVWNEGHAWLVTRLMHSSGQSIESVYPLAQYNRPQEMGSALTYARRYSITALLGIAAEEDDDGAAAESGTPVEGPPRRNPPSRDDRPSGQPAQGVSSEEKPACPEHHTSEKVILSRFPKNGKWYCLKCEVGFNDEAGGL